MFSVFSWFPWCYARDDYVLCVVSCTFVYHGVVSKTNIFILKSWFVFPNSILLEPSLFMVLPFFVEEFLDWIMHSKGDILWARCTFCMAQIVWVRALLAWWFEWISQYVGVCFTCVHAFKISGLVCSLKSFKINSLSLWYKFMLNPIALYMLMSSYFVWWRFSLVTIGRASLPYLVCYIHRWKQLRREMNTHIFYK